MRLPSYRRHKSGQARVTIAGRDFYLGEYGSPESKRAYNRIVAEFLASNRSKLFGVDESRISVAQLLVAYLKHAKGYYGVGPGSEWHRIKPVAKVLKELYGDSLAGEFGTLHAKAVVEHLKRTEGRSRPYVAKMTARLKRIFRWAASEGLVGPTISAAVCAVQLDRAGRSSLREPDAILPVDQAVVDQTIPFLSSVVGDMVRFQGLTGCRPGEVCQIAPAMVDRSGDVWTATLKEHKTAHRGKTRVIYIPKPAQDVIAKYLLRAPEDYCFSPREARDELLAKRSEARTTPLHWGNSPGTNREKRPLRRAGDCYTTASYGRAIARACEKAFPPPSSLKSKAELDQWRIDHAWSPNQLRHLFATKVRAEYGLDVSQVLLGHSSVGVTQVYAEVDRSKAIESVRRMSS